MQTFVSLFGGLLAFAVIAYLIAVRSK